MKTTLLFLFLFFVQLSNAQKKPFPVTCPDLKEKMQLIKQSFSNLARFKKNLLPGSTYEYATSISICGVTGEMQLFENGTELQFNFKEDRFTDDEGKLVSAFVAEFRKTVKVVFGDRYEENYGKESDDLWGVYEYYEFHPYTGYYPLVRIDYPYAGDHCRITFQYEK